MRGRYWQLELWVLATALVLLPALASLFGFGSEVLISIIVVYLAWHLVQIYRLYRWQVSSRQLYPPGAVGIWSDIFHEIYLSQKSNRDQRRKLKEIIAEFRASTAAMPDGALILDSTEEIRWFNKAAAALLGLKTATDQGQRITNLIRNPRFLEYEQSRDYDQPLVIPSPLDESVTLSFQITPYSKDQRLMLVRDITRVQKLERIRQDFVANVSHELRTPLTVINGYLEMLGEGDSPELKAINKPLQQMRQQALNMGHLVDDLLLLSRLDSIDEEHTRHSPVDVNLLLDSICAEARVLGKEKEQTVLFRAGTELGLMGSEKLLRSAFANLAFNAVRYTPAKGRILLEWQRQGDELIMSVTDNGPGIEAEHIPRLTERFYRVDSGRTRRQGGTGLGLAIVKHALELHQGRLQIDSTPGKGSVFRCHFPASLAIEP